MIFQGNDTPYAKAMAKKEASDSVGALIYTDAEIKGLIECNTLLAKAQTLLYAIHEVSTAYYLPDNHKVNLVKKLSEGGEAHEPQVKPVG